MEIQLGQDVSSAFLTQTSVDNIFLRPQTIFNEAATNSRRFLLESTDSEVPASFQTAWKDLLTERNGNIGILDGFQFVTDTLMVEEGFRKLREVDAEEKETESIRRSYYSHLSKASNDGRYSCVILFSRPVLERSKPVVIQSALSDQFRKNLPSGRTVAPVTVLPSRYWVNNAYSGSLRSNVVEMYRNLPELAIKLKDELVFKLKSIIAHGLTPPLLVGLDSLPLDVLECVFIRSSVESAVSLAQTCKRAYCIFSLENVWRSMARREFDSQSAISDEEVRGKFGSWRQAFISWWKTKNHQRRIRNLNFHQAYQPGLGHPWRYYPEGAIPRLDQDPFNDNFF